MYTVVQVVLVFTRGDRGLEAKGIGREELYRNEVRMDRKIGGGENYIDV